MHAMNYRLPISSTYRTAIFEALTLQFLTAVFSLMILDLGQTAQICGIAIVAFWAGAATLICRHRQSPTTTDITLVRFGFLLVLVISFFLVGFIWRLRGF
jgi:hypothetical protein